MESIEQIKEALAEHNEALTENHVIKEMIDTEQTLNNALHFLETVLAKDELVKGVPVLVEFKKILPALITISDKLLLNASDTLKLANDHPDRNLLKEQRTQLLKAFFSVYPDCSKLYLEYATLEKSEAKFSDVLSDIKKYVSQIPTNRLDLAALLIQPVQRGPRYAMLVEAAISYNDRLAAGHPAKLTEAQITDLKGLATMIKDLLIAVNKSMSENKEEPKKEEPYYFGYYTKTYLLDYLTPSPVPQETATAAKTPPPTVKEYQPGDYLRGALSGFWKPAITAAVPNEMPKTEDNEEDKGSTPTTPSQGA